MGKGFGRSGFVATRPDVRRGLEEAQSKDAGRRTETGYEVWYTLDERARNREVLKSTVWGVLYKSGVYASKVVSLTLGGLPGVRGSGLRGERSLLTAVQKSAEGVVAESRRSQLGTPKPKGGGTDQPSRNARSEGRNGGEDE
jgi:hypothetical protein